MHHRSYFYLQTTKEFFYSCILAILFCISFPNQLVFSVYTVLVQVLTQIPLNISTILLWNLLNAWLIFLLGKIRKEFISFFIALNGIALGLMIGLYQNNISLLLSLLFPHAFFETMGIILLCSEFKIISYFQKTIHIEEIRKSWNIIIFICIPLFVFAALIEGLRFH